MALLYWHLAGLLIAGTNQDVASHGQKSLLAETIVVSAQLHSNQMQGISQTWQNAMPHRADASAAPLWPWLVACCSGAPLAEETPLFIRGKWINVVVTLTFLLLMGLMLGRRLSVLATLNVCLLIGFGVLLPQAVYYRPEALFYVLYFLAFACAIQLLRRNSLWWHLLFGLLCAMAYLTKGSVDLLIVSWLSVTALRFLNGVLSKESETPWNCRCHFIGLIVFGFAFLAVLWPYLASNQQEHGSFFHPWHRDWQTISVTGTPLREPLAQYFAANPYPSWWHTFCESYQTHLQQFFLTDPRLGTAADGWKTLLDQSAVYLGALCGLLLIAGLYARSRGPAWFQDGKAWPAGTGAVIFLVCLMVFCHSLQAGFYEISLAEDRVLMLLYAPLVFVILWAAETLYAWAVRRGRGGRGWRLAYQMVQLALLGHICYRLFLLIQSPTFAPQLTL